MIFYSISTDDGCGDEIDKGIWTGGLDRIIAAQVPNTYSVLYIRETPIKNGENFPVLSIASRIDAESKIIHEIARTCEVKWNAGTMYQVSMPHLQVSLANQARSKLTHEELQALTTSILER